MYSSFPLSEHLIGVETLIKDVSRGHKIEIPSPIGDTMDHSQIAAVDRIMGKRLALVQGPPGTGKTFVSVQALKILLEEHYEEGDPPIVIACQTNHALDQLLTHVADFAPDFVRLGGRSQDAAIKQKTIFETRRAQTGQYPRSGLFGRSMKEIKSFSRRIVELLAPLESGSKFLDPAVLEQYGLLNDKQHASLVKCAQGWITAGTADSDTQNVFELWLGQDQIERAERPGQVETFDSFEELQDIEELRELEAEQMADEEEEMLDQTYHIALADSFDGKNGGGMRDELLKRLLDTKNDMGTLPAKVRGPIYRYLLRQLKRELLAEFRAIAVQFAQATHNRQIGRWEEDAFILSKRKIIGVTTTGLSKYRAVIAAVKPKMVLIEEAAESLEGPIIAACLESIEQLVLVGDHKQLRPQCHFKQLEDFNLNISMFERLIDNGLDFSLLSRQRRMIPAVRQLLRPIYGDAITDHPYVTEAKNRPLVPGMGDKSVWFLSHAFPENRDGQMSYYNPLEAEMIVQFIRYLTVNGTPAETITVLTFYQGQRRSLVNLLKNFGMWSSQAPKVATVDSYQSEENSIVILSLVRNNSYNKIGFVGVDSTLR